MMANSQDSVLVVIDVQQKLAKAMPEGVRERLNNQIKTLLTAAKVLNIPVIVTEQYPKGLGPTEPELQENLPLGTKIIEKTCFSCMQSPDFRYQLAATRRNQVILVGMETHICVLQTALTLKAENYRVHVVEDGVCSRAKSNQYNSLHRLRHAGVIVSNVESVLFEWLGDAGHAEFKTLAKLIV
ncbi:hydrolase [Methylophaga sp.]|uniref:hydrolase n=1 Tax=Methylophaga sp. TaxID=2024840 RepID=UPI00271BA291|nr:hydrolase [Methylophaga sp.]MDO8825268.1 hydrolase [Methylophaga sp.]